MKLFNSCMCVMGGAGLLSAVLSIVGLAVGGYALCFILGLAGLVLDALVGLVFGIRMFQ